MREQEVQCFAETIGIGLDDIAIFDLLDKQPLSRSRIDSVDVLLLGGSDHSVVSGGPWLERALDAMRLLVEVGKPTFASCWGFQAIARALGGRVVRDSERAEIGTVTVERTKAGDDDPVFSALPRRFDAQMGHQDVVAALPEGAVALASSDRVEFEAYRFLGKPIYGTQFHPELSRRRLLERLVAYPHYVERIAGVPLDKFIAACRETPQSAMLLPQFLKVVFS